MNDDIENEEPLDPAVEAVRVKMVRLLMVSGGTMMLGLMAVVAAIVYKINQNEPPVASSAVPTVAEVKIPNGAQVLSSSFSDSNLVLMLKRQNGETLIRRYDGQGQLVSEYSVIEE